MRSGGEFFICTIMLVLKKFQILEYLTFGLGMLYLPLLNTSNRSDLSPKLVSKPRHSGCFRCFCLSSMLHNIIKVILKLNLLPLYLYLKSLTGIPIIFWIKSKFPSTGQKILYHLPLLMYCPFQMGYVFSLTFLPKTEARLYYKSLVYMN